MVPLSAASGPDGTGPHLLLSHLGAPGGLSLSGAAYTLNGALQAGIAAEDQGHALHGSTAAPGPTEYKPNITLPETR